MQKELIEYPEIKLLGISARTCNANEMNPDTGIIGPIIQNYLQQQIADMIPNRSHPLVTFAAYTEYATDVNGEYTYFMGEQVESFADVPETLTCITIPPQTCMKFTTAPGVMPNVVIEAWQAIWAMDRHELCGERGYVTDFEVYDQRAVDPQNSIVDICIGIRPE